jgi:hypothetical protein
MKFGKSSHGCETRPTKAEPGRWEASLAPGGENLWAMRRYASERAAGTSHETRNPDAQGVIRPEGSSGTPQSRARGRRIRRGVRMRRAARGWPSNLGGPAVSVRERKAGDGDPRNNPDEATEASACEPRTRTSARPHSRPMARGTGARAQGQRESEGCIRAEKSGNGWQRTRRSKGGPCRG